MFWLRMCTLDTASCISCRPRNDTRVSPPDGYSERKRPEANSSPRGSRPRSAAARAGTTPARQRHTHAAYKLSVVAHGHHLHGFSLAALGAATDERTHPRRSAARHGANCPLSEMAQPNPRLGTLDSMNRQIHESNMNRGLNCAPHDLDVATLAAAISAIRSVRQLPRPATSLIR